MKVRIEQRHYACGERNLPEFCAVALAIKDVIRPDVRVRVHVSDQDDDVATATFVTKGCFSDWRTTIQLSQAANKVAREFDLTGRGPSTVFEADIPGEYLP